MRVPEARREYDGCASADSVNMGDEPLYAGHLGNVARRPGLRMIRLLAGLLALMASCDSFIAFAVSPAWAAAVASAEIFGIWQRSPWFSHQPQWRGLRERWLRPLLLPDLALMRIALLQRLISSLRPDSLLAQPLPLFLKFLCIPSRMSWHQRAYSCAATAAALAGKHGRPTLRRTLECLR